MIKIFKNKLVFLFILIFLFSGLFFYFNYDFSFEAAQAGTNDNLNGWAWSDNIGWISFNKTECDTKICRDRMTHLIMDYSCSPAGSNPCTDNGGQCRDWCRVCENDSTVLCENSNECGAGNDCVNNDYGVNLDAEDNNNLEGYAWSSGVGWIQFDPGSGFPESPDRSAYYDTSDKKIKGWAHILSLGNDGWVKFTGTTTSGDEYSVSVNDNCQLEGWAYNGASTTEEAAIGWINFNYNDVADQCDTDGDGYFDGGPSWCTTSGEVYEYLVRGASVYPIALNAPNLSPCQENVHHANLEWDLNRDIQGYYQIIMDNDNDMSDPIYDSGKVTSTDSYDMVDVNDTNLSDISDWYEESYYWWLKVWNAFGCESDWVQFDQSPGAHQVTLDSLNPGQTYTFEVKSTDPSGNTGSSTTFTVDMPSPSSDWPEISGVGTSSLGVYEASIEWTTNPAVPTSDNHLIYSEDPDFSSFDKIEQNDGDNTLHEVDLGGLDPDTKYFYYVQSGSSTDKNIIDGVPYYYNFKTNRP